MFLNLFFSFISSPINKNSKFRRNLERINLFFDFLNYPRKTDIVESLITLTELIFLWGDLCYSHQPIFFLPLHLPLFLPRHYLILRSCLYGHLSSHLCDFATIFFLKGNQMERIGHPKIEEKVTFDQGIDFDLGHEKWFFLRFGGNLRDELFFVDYFSPSSFNLFDRVILKIFFKILPINDAD